MRKTQRVNDACACGSERIYKECCIYRRPAKRPLHRTVEPPKLHLHRAVEPATMAQQFIRAHLAQLMQHITVPHCRVCGDTAELSNLVTVPTPQCDIVLCEFCYNVQIRM